MVFTYSIPDDINTLLARADFLGFDNQAQAANAILTHRDWSKRWEVSTTYDAINGQTLELLSPGEVNRLHDWRRTILNDIRAQKYQSCDK